jgi:hypothetical protein
VIGGDVAGTLSIVLARSRTNVSSVFWFNDYDEFTPQELPIAHSKLIGH